jgi:hypothetical protein
MFHRLVSHNDDIRQLVEKGYALDFDSNYLIVRDIPYLNETLGLRWGTFVVKLVFITNDEVKLEDHQVFFAGILPFNLDGTPVTNLNPRAATLPLSPKAEDIKVTWQFSNKPSPPRTGFTDFYEKIESYTTLIAGPAMEKYSVSPLTFRAPYPEEEDDSVFLFRDSLTSRAEITEFTAKLKDDRVAIIGLGGTGAFVLEYLSRTPVREIRAFDPDDFFIHNAFRSPGRLNEAELGKKKVEVYHGRYESFRKGINFSASAIDRDSGAEIENITFAFVCVDKGSARAGIFDLLLSRHIPFIDVGMDLRKKETGLTGMLRTTYYPADRGEWVRSQGFAELNDTEAGLYHTHVQIGELNALNAALAVVRFKQLRGFYADDENFCQLLWGVMDMGTAGESLDE